MSPAASPSRVSEPMFAEEVDQGPIRIHMPPPRSATITEPQPPAPSGIKPFAYLKYRWVTVVFLGGLLASILSVTAWKLIPSKFTTSSMVRVFSDNPVMYAQENAQARNDFATYIKTQANLIRSHFVLTAALRDPVVAALPMLREQADPVRFLEEELKIETQEGSEIIKISLSGEDPRACAMIVNAIQDAFFREVVDSEITRKKSRLKQLEDNISRSQSEVKEKYGQFKVADVDTPETDAGNLLSASMAMDQLMRLEENQAKLESDLKSWENEQESLEKRLKNLDDEVPPLPPGFLQSVDNDPKMQTLAKKIETQTKQADYFTQLSGDAKAPSVVELRRSISEAKKQREQFRQERMDEYQRSQLPMIEKKLKLDLEHAKSVVLHLTNQKEKLDESLEKYAKTVSQNGPGEVLPNFMKADLKKRSQLIVDMYDKANLLRLEVNAPPRVQDVQRAAVPLKKEMKKQLFGTILAGLMGFGMVGLGIVLYESRVRRVLALADVEKNVLGPIVGVLPACDVSVNTLALAEAIEKTRSQLTQQFGRPGGKIVSVTSAIAEESKGFLAGQLAESFARIGSRTLLMDFDLRAPSLHQAYGVGNERGLCEVMLGQVEFKDVVQGLPNGMMFVPAGNWSSNVRLGLTLDRLEAFLNWLRPQFDYVILNAHPLLSVAETYLLCRSSDGVLLSVQRLESRMPLVARAHEKLASAAPEAFGVVFQGANAEECLQ
jgi:polysaccharide biosynthesis transport protein